MRDSTNVTILTAAPVSRDEMHRPDPGRRQFSPCNRYILPKSPSALKRDLAAHDRDIDPRVGDFCVGDSQNVLREDDDVGKLAHGQRAFLVVFEGGPRCIAGVASQGFLAGHALLGKEQPAVAHLPRHRRVKTENRIDIFHWKDGKVAESWTEWDNLGLGRRLGAAPPEGSFGEKLGMRMQRLMARRMRKKNQGV